MHYKGKPCPECGKKTTLNFLNFDGEDKIMCTYCYKSFTKMEWLK
jgi:phage/plasmid primase-like uncharacterized protein